MQITPYAQSTNIYLPTSAIIEKTAHHDFTRALELCGPLKAGEIVVFDNAYIHFEHPFKLNRRGLFWVTRAKDNMSYTVAKELPVDSTNVLLTT